MDSFRAEIRTLLTRIEVLEHELASMSFSQSDPGAMMERSKMKREISDARKRVTELLSICLAPRTVGSQS